MKIKHALVLLTAVTISLSGWAERISEADAALVANNFMNAAPSSSTVKTTTAKRMVLKKAASEEANQYYVYENANGEGWVMVAANDVVRPILAYSNTGTFRTDNQPSNVKAWLGKYDKFIQKMEAEGVTTNEETSSEWNDLRNGIRKDKGDAVVGPLVKTTWDQDAPYWNLCPGSGSSKAYTGCVATAMAQVMNYWQYPKKGTGKRTYKPRDPNNPDSYSSRYTSSLSADFGNTTYDWENMKNSYSGSYTDAEATAVATLMYHCGVATEMMYGNDDDDGSGTYTVNYGDWDWGTNEGECAQNALVNYFGYNKSTLTGYMRDGYSNEGTTYYTKWSDADWTAMIKAELDKKRPIMYGGSGTKGGHSFICDGYDDAGYFHFNWGWSGDNDGYYKLDDLRPGSGGAGGGSYDFSDDQDALIGIQPAGVDVNVTWYANGEKFAETVAEYGVLSMPATTPTACANGKVFVGWTASSNYEGEVAPTFVKEGEFLQSAATYYAVYAVKSEGTGSIEDQLTNANTTNSTATTYSEWNGVSVNSPAIYAGQSAGSNSTIQLRSNNSNSGIVTTVSGGMAKKVSVVWNSGTASGRTLNVYGSNSAYSAPTDLYSSSTWGTLIGTIVYGTSTELTISGTYEYIGVRSNGSSLYLDAITFVWEGSSYGDYSTECGSDEACELTGIELNTTNVTKEFTMGSTFSAEDLVVTAKYSNCNNRNVTRMVSIIEPDMSTAGTKTVTVRYEENNVTKEASYEITVHEPTIYSIGFYNNGELIGQVQQVTEGQAAVPPTEVETCEGYTFAGWVIDAIAQETTKAPSFVQDFTVIGDQNYYAVFSKTVTSQGGSAATLASVTFKEAAIDGTTAIESNIDIQNKLVESSTGIYEFKGYKLYASTYGIKLGTSSATGDITLVFPSEISISTVKVNAIRYKTNTSKLDLMCGNETPFGEPQTLNEILTEMTFTATSAISTDELTVSTATGGLRAYIKSIEVLGEGNGSSSVTYYTSAPDCTPVEPCVLTGITLNTDNVQKAFKTGDVFNAKGLVVTANYSNCDNKVVTASVTAPDMTSAGTKNVTVSYTENEITKTAEYEITISEPASYEIAFYNNDALVGEKQTIVEGSIVTPPAEVETCEGYTFAGWVTEAISEETTTAPTIVKDFTVTKDQNYYAVFSRTEEGEGGEGGNAGTEDKLTRELTGISGTNYGSWSDISVTSAAVYAGQSAGGNDAIQLRSNNNNSGIITTTSGGKIGKVSVEWNSNTTSTRTLNIYGSNTAYTNATDLYNSEKAGTLLGTIVCEEGASTELIVQSEYEYVGVRSASGALYMDAISFIWGGTGAGGNSTTYYTTAPECEPVVPCVLDGIELNTDNVKKEFLVGSEFTAEGLIVYATFENECADKDVSNQVRFEVPDMNTTGQKDVIVTYTDNENNTAQAAYVITVKEPDAYAVGFYNNGVLIGEKQMVTEGQAAVPPTEVEGCEDYTFAGWVTEELATDNTTEPTYVTDFTITGEQEFYAVFTKTEESEGPTGGATSEDKLTRELTGISGTNYSSWSGKSVSSPAVYAGQSAGGNSSIQLRSNNNNSGIITTTSGGQLTKVSVTWNTNTSNGRILDIYGSNTAYTAPTDLYNSSTQGTQLGSITYNGTNTSAELAIEGEYTYVGVRSRSGAMYMTDITFTWASGGSSTVTYFTTAPNCEPAALCVLTEITLNTDDVIKTFKTTDEFSAEGLVVTAKYDNCQDRNKTTEAIIVAPDMTTAGTKTVTVSYTENDVTKEATYEITVAEAATYSIGFYNNGELIGEVQQVKEGQAAVPPTNVEACGNYSLAGWSIQPLDAETMQTPTLVKDFTAKGDMNYYAVFSKPEEGGALSDNYQKINSIDMLTSGKYLVVGSYNNGFYAMKNAKTGNYIAQQQVTPDADAINTTDVNIIWEIAVENNTLSFYNEEQDEFIYLYQESSKNYADFTDDTSKGIYFTYSLSDEGSWDFVSVSLPSLHLEYYGEKEDFTAYTKVGDPIYLFKQQAPTYYTSAPNCDACDNVLTVSKGNAANGSFELSREGEMETCNHDIKISVVEIAPEEGYRFKEITQEGIEDAVVDQQAKTVTYPMNSTGASTINVLFEQIPSYTVRFYNNTELIGEEQTVLEGEAAVAPREVTACGDYIFAGWLTEAMTEESTQAPEFVKNFTATKDQNYYAVFTKSEESEDSMPAVTDTLVNANTIGAEANTYSEWADKSFMSSAVYAGNTAGGNKAIQLRSSNNNSGIITTVSGGMVSHIAVMWNENTAADRTLDIYAKSSAYEATTDLYDADKRGSKIGSIANGTNELAIEGAYEFIGLRSNSGAMYLDTILVTWGGSHVITYYTSAPNCEACDNILTISKGNAANGTFALSREGDAETCARKIVVTVTNITPEDGFRFKEITQEGVEDAVIDQQAKTVTYAKNSTGASTINVLFEQIPSYTVRFIVNGEPIDEQTVMEGKQAVKPEDPQGEEGYKFVGWWNESLPTDNTESHGWINDFTVKADADYFAIFAHTLSDSGEPTDNVFTREETGVEGTGYQDWTKTIGSAQYAGNSAGGNDAIQLRTDTKTSGVVTLVSGGKALKVTIEWNENTAAGRKLDIYGKNTAYEAPSDLYDNEKQGTKLGSIEYSGTAASTGKRNALAAAEGEFTVEGDYTYIGIRSNDKALYLNKFTVTWETATIIYTSTMDKATKIENSGSEQPSVMKVLRNGQILIIRGEDVYTVTGARVQ